METSFFLAQLLGPFFLLIGLMLAARPDDFRVVAEEFLASRALIFVAGLFAFLPGLAIVLTHNVWAADWRLVITLLGWLALIGGVFRLLFPLEVRAIGRRMMARAGFVRVAGFVAMALGMILAFAGFLT